MKNKGILGVLIILQIFVLFYFAQQELAKYYAKRWVQDDAYISFRFAKHFVDGKGLVYNPGQYVEGYTNFLWTMISAIPISLKHDDPLPFMHQVSWVLWVLSYLMTFIIGARLVASGIWLAPLASIPLLYHYSYNMWYFSGMETPLVSFFTIAIVFFFSFDQKKYIWPLFFAAVSGVGLMMTRPDGVFMVAGVAVAGLFNYWESIFKEKKWQRFILVPAIPFLLIFLPYTIWRVSYYGSFYPNTYYAKVAYLTHYSRGWGYIKTYFMAYPILIWLFFLTASIFLAPKGVIRRYIEASTLGMLFVFFYIVRLGGDFMEWRFVTPVTGVIYPAIIIGVSVTVQRIVNVVLRIVRKKIETSQSDKITGLPAVGFGMVASVIGIYLLATSTSTASKTTRSLTADGQESIELLSRYCDPKLQFNWGIVGKTFNEVLPLNVHIATTSAGIIPFYCDRPCLDLHGLTDPVIAREIITPETRGRVGHEHWLQDFNKMRERGVDIYLYWADPKMYAMARAQPAIENNEMVSVQLPNKKYVEIAILNHETVDVDSMKKNPKLVFFDPSRFFDKKGIYVLKDVIADCIPVGCIDIGENQTDPDFKFDIFAESGNPVNDHHIKSQAYYSSVYRQQTGNNDDTLHTAQQEDANEPSEEIVVEDSGIRIHYGARIGIRKLNPEKDLIMLLRYDTGRGNYSITVNNTKTDLKFIPKVASDFWDEALIRIPGRYLSEEWNQIELIRDKNPEGNTELYYAWFFQPEENSTHIEQ